MDDGVEVHVVVVVDMAYYAVQESGMLRVHLRCTAVAKERGCRIAKVRGKGGVLKGSD